MTANALELTGLCKRYRGFTLRDATFTLPSGYVMGLIGPNGAGKTTLIKLIMNLVRRDAGTVKVFGLDNRQHEVEVKSRIGFVYDVPGFYEDVTLDAHRRAIAPFYSRWRDDTFARLAGEFELPLGTKYKKLSQGMKTKFALAVALSHEADLLVMDEPTSGLDPGARRDLLRRLAAFLQDERRSVLFSTHITTDLERIADYITFVDAGEIRFSLPKDELLDRWAVVRGGDSVGRALNPSIVRGARHGGLGSQWLVSDKDVARRDLGGDALVDRVTLDDVMVLMAGETRHAA
jgi:ABC-2 type transport system ATP-binding protein